MVHTILRCFLLLLVGSIHIVAQSISFTLESRKSRHVEGEWIFLELRVKNEGSAVVEISPPDPWGNDIAYVCRTRSGVVIRYTGPSVNVVAGRKIKLLTGQEVTETIQLDYLYGDRISNASTWKALPPGEYILEMTYAANAETKLSASQAVHVLAPTGTEKQMFDDLKATLRSLSFRQMTREQAILSFQEIEGRIPSSPYASVASSIVPAWLRFSLDNPSAAQEASKAALIKHPEIALVPGFLSGTIRRIPKGEERQSFLRSIESLLGRQDSVIVRTARKEISRGEQK